MANMADDPRIDPRIKAVMGHLVPEPSEDVPDRETLLAVAASDSAREYAETRNRFFDAIDTEDTASFEGLRSGEFSFVSEPGGHSIRARFIRPDHDDVVPCVVYLHGGGMMSMSAFNGLYHSWGRLIAANDVAVAMIDFRNSLEPSTAEEVAPYPAGLDDCVNGVRHVLDHAGELGIDPGRVVVSGESGGGNLTLATGMRFLRDGDDRIAGLFALCPYINGAWPDERYPSSVENNGYLIEIHSNRGRMAYGIEAFDRRDPLAWPGFATVDDVRGLPPTVISVNECDPLRDEGVAFYRLLLAAGVPARAREMLGTIHGTEIFSIACPDISRETASAIAEFAWGSGVS